MEIITALTIVSCENTMPFFQDLVQNCASCPVNRFKIIQKILFSIARTLHHGYRDKMNDKSYMENKDSRSIKKLSTYTIPKSAK